MSYIGDSDTFVQAHKTLHTLTTKYISHATEWFTDSPLYVHRRSNVASLLTSSGLHSLRSRPHLRQTHIILSPGPRPITKWSWAKVCVYQPRAEGHICFPQVAVNSCSSQWEAWALRWSMDGDGQRNADRRPKPKTEPHTMSRANLLWMWHSVMESQIFNFGQERVRNILTLLLES